MAFLFRMIRGVYPSTIHFKDKVSQIDGITGIDPLAGANDHRLRG